MSCYGKFVTQLCGSLAADEVVEVGWLYLDWFNNIVMFTLRAGAGAVVSY